MGAKETTGRTAFELAAIHGHHQLVGKKQEKLWRSSSIPPRPDLHVVTARDVSMWPRPRRVHWSDVNQKRLRTNAAHGNWTQVRAHRERRGCSRASRGQTQKDSDVCQVSFDILSVTCRLTGITEGRLYQL